jgi:hypothetical protein
MPYDPLMRWDWEGGAVPLDEAEIDDGELRDDEAGPRAGARRLHEPSPGERPGGRSDGDSARDDGGRPAGREAATP